MANQDLQVQLLLTGNEIMSGDTIDSNSALIARRLGELAVGVYRKVTVGDDVPLLQRELGDVPLVGFFANGEISHDRLYAYTGVLTVFT